MIEAASAQLAMSRAVIGITIERGMFRAMGAVAAFRPPDTTEGGVRRASSARIAVATTSSGVW
jgi:hypothetical protein